MKQYPIDTFILILCTYHNFIEFAFKRGKKKIKKKSLDFIKNKQISKLKNFAII